jgi:hypothetical protein
VRQDRLPSEGETGRWVEPSLGIVDITSRNGPVARSDTNVCPDDDTFNVRENSHLSKGHHYERQPYDLDDQVRRNGREDTHTCSKTLSRFACMPAKHPMDHPGEWFCHCPGIDQFPKFRQGQSSACGVASSCVGHHRLTDVRLLL